MYLWFQQLNICGVSSSCGLDNGHQVAACDESKVNIGEMNDKLEFSEDGEITLKYEGLRMTTGEFVSVYNASILTIV